MLRTTHELRHAPHAIYNGWYAETRKRIRSGDVLLYRPCNLLGRLIARLGRSEYSHAAMAAWWGERLMCLESLQGVGGRAALLSHQVHRWPGIIDVYGPIVHLDRAVVLEAMIGITGRRYGWWSLLRAAVLHLPVARLLVRPETDDAANGTLPFCSQAVAMAYRAAGLDLVPNLADRLTEPGDLARSADLHYLCTLH